MKPYCFVLMPFGKKSDEGGRVIDFDRVYSEVIQPAVTAAGLEPIRADEDAAGGIIHKPMFERLMLCDYAIADLTTANANVFYELGIRHGIRPHSTILMFGKGSRLPFDVEPLRGLPYPISETGVPEDVAESIEALGKRLEACKDPSEDSPLFQLVDDWPRPDIARLKTDRFREAVEYSKVYKSKLLAARTAGYEAVRAVELELGKICDVDPAIVIDLYLSYRAVKAWDAMIALVDIMSPLLARTILVREQFGFALNRVGRRVEAEAVLRRIVDEHGASSETNGILGRVYKDQWQEAFAQGRLLESRGLLRKAIDTYRMGFESDMRDAYPGINALTLMECAEPVDPRQQELLPVVRYAAKRRLALTSADYWDYATLVELEVLAGDQVAAIRALEDALGHVREIWEPETTARNLQLISDVRARQNVDIAWLSPLIKELLARAHAESSTKS
ncbi:TRAFs-binding domain-containing protein [Paraburkholderia haematera]|uniref:MAP3K TRAFs-binding domain-containing protein n=1 Tax=Paraburkholderia haematera TaxID=2793077 RepID=A0ABM8SW59_9BURK|nr:TRAFs-binding domain-containing protein [Paraburkholderia haematera]CAE6837492.1 hypothetical protein R69888_06839 [Paraburkholderia haematera]